MLSYSQFFLFEEKLKHITHLEDLIFYYPMSQIAGQVDSMVKALTGGDSSSITMKFDGAPSLVAGTCPETGRFFVATKSLFNKTPKINYTEADVDANHKGGLADKLKCALKYLPSVFPANTVLQGDFLFGGSDKGVTTKTIDDVKYLTFTPNSLTYAVPVGSVLAGKVNKAKLGVVWHTTYSGRTIAGLSASAGADTSGFRTSPNVLTLDTHIPDASAAFLSSSEVKMIKKLMHPYRDLKIKMSEDLLWYVAIFVNDQFRSVNTNEFTVKDLIEFLRIKLQGEMDKLKTDAAKQKIKDKLQRLIDEVHSCGMQKIFAAHNAFYKIKNILLTKLNTIQGNMSVFTQSSNGFEVANDEGFVFAGASGGVVKIVDRIGFSLYNFQNSRVSNR